MAFQLVSLIQIFNNVEEVPSMLMAASSIRAIAENGKGKR